MSPGRRDLSAHPVGTDQDTVRPVDLGVADVAAILATDSAGSGPRADDGCQPLIDTSTDRQVPSVASLIRAVIVTPWPTPSSVAVRSGSWPCMIHFVL